MTSQKIQVEKVTQLRYKGIGGSLWNAVSSCMGKWVKMKLKISIGMVPGEVLSAVPKTRWRVQQVLYRSKSRLSLT